MEAELPMACLVSCYGAAVSTLVILLVVGLTSGAESAAVGGSESSLFPCTGNGSSVSFARDVPFFENPDLNIRAGCALLNLGRSVRVA